MTSIVLNGFLELSLGSWKRFQLKSFIYQRWHFKSFNVITKGGLWDAIHYFSYSLFFRSELQIVDWCALCLCPDFVMNEIWHFLVLMKAMKCNHNGLKKNSWLILPHLWQECRDAKVILKQVYLINFTRKTNTDDLDNYTQFFLYTLRHWRLRSWKRWEKGGELGLGLSLAIN